MDTHEKVRAAKRALSGAVERSEALPEDAALLELHDVAYAVLKLLRPEARRLRNSVL